MCIREFNDSGMNAGGLLHSRGAQFELLQVLARGYHFTTDDSSALDAAWSEAQAPISCLAIESAVGGYFSFNPGKAHRTFMPVAPRSAPQRGTVMIGTTCDGIYDAHFSSACIHSLHPEQHMSALSKRVASYFGHSFTDINLFWCIDAKKRKELLALVPPPTRRALRSVLETVRAEGAARRKIGRGRDDESGIIDDWRRQLKAVNLRETEKARRGEIEAWLVQERLSWPTMRTPKTGWFHAKGASKAQAYIAGGSEAAVLAEVFDEARRLHEEHHQSRAARR